MPSDMPLTCCRGPSVHATNACQPGQRVTTDRRAGDQRPGTAPADVVFVVLEKPHALFRREGNDLHYVLRVPLVDALCGATHRLTTLDGRPLSVPVSGIAGPASEKVVRGEGMPISKVRSGLI